MCLTAQALALFLSMLPSDRIESDTHTVTILADVGPAIWVPVADKWCTEAPSDHQDAMFARLNKR